MFENLKEILVLKLKMPPEHIVPEATKEDIELDSLAAVELSVILGERGITISDDELLEAATVGEMAKLIESRSTNL
ncbi:phosphopantetheine-binding protein [Streptomyces sp. NPDC051909]|uniref:acyl carrier protein n=1 Tax=Streptomyces sp. NPDC051909 TaxID=3154944 RepID=UPI0034312DD5